MAASSAQSRPATGQRRPRQRMIAARVRAPMAMRPAASVSGGRVASATLISMNDPPHNTPSTSSSR